MQVHAQHRYRLQRYDAKVVLFDPDGPYNGLLAAQFAPYVSDLDVRTIALGEPSARTRALAERFPARIQALGVAQDRSEEHTSELQSLMRTSYAVFCLKKKKQSLIRI